MTDYEHAFERMLLTKVMTDYEHAFEGILFTKVNDVILYC